MEKWSLFSGSQALIKFGQFSLAFPFGLFSDVSTPHSAIEAPSLKFWNNPWKKFECFAQNSGFAR
jgi:hypothetical protein